MTQTARRRTRREFLKQSGGLLAGSSLAFGFPTIVPRSVVAGAKETPPSERILIGHIGVGNQGGGNLVRHLKNTVAVCDVDAHRLDAAKARVEKATGQACAAYA